MERIKNVDSVQKKYPDILSSVLLLVYGFLTVFTPNMRTFDSNGPKFFTLALLNILVFTYFFFISPERKDRSQLFKFFRSNVGLAYALMMLMALLSFFKAWNISESILHFSKIFTTFTAAWMVFLLVLRDKRALFPLAVGMSLLLILDSVHTFQGVRDFVIAGKGGIGAVKSSYSNKNILSSAIFLKLPFAIWLLYFQKNWSRYLGGLALFSGFLATFFLGARAFLLGTIVLSLVLFVYGFVRYRQVAEKKYFKYFAIYFGTLLLAFGTFFFVQKNVYPKKAQAVGVGARLSTITDKNNHSNNLRLAAWGQSLQMMKKEPLFGVGIGNWKIRVLEYENSYNPTYTYTYKNHNDFLETAAEYGIIGGLAFIAIFIFTFLYLVKVLFIKRDEEVQYLFFLPLVGLVTYFFDAFFNFPQDRPEIQSLFAIYVGTAAALGVMQWNRDSFLSKFNFKGIGVLYFVLSLILGLLSLGTTYILKENVASLKLQRIVKEEISRHKLKSSSERFINGFPAIPNITILAEPISVQKARYFIKEKKYNQARDIMRNDKTNPFDGRKEYFMANTFFIEKKYDSALYYAKEALKVKPFFYNTNVVVDFVYKIKGEHDKSIQLWKNYLKGVKNKSEAWSALATLLMQKNKIKEAEVLLDSAYKYLPQDKKILGLRVKVKQRMLPPDKLLLYKKANKLYNEKKYKSAISLLNTLSKDAHEFVQAYHLRAMCYFRLLDYKNAIADINSYERIAGKLSASMFNIRGASYYNLGYKDNAKVDLKKAMEMGDRNAKDNYNRLFKKDDKPISFRVPVKK